MQANIRKTMKQETNLNRLRTYIGITQNELVVQNYVPLKTLQKYEQRQKVINKAKTEYVVSLVEALCCAPRRVG